MAEDDVKVLSTWMSMFGMRVLIALEEKGVKYEYQEENLQEKSQLLLKSNPIHKKIPVLIHNDKAVCESLIIVQYIDEAWDSTSRPNFLPKTPYDRAVARFWADYVDKKFYDAGSRIISSPAGELQEQAKADLTEIISTLDKALQEVACGKPFYGGDSIGLVDIAVAPFISWFRAYEVIGDLKLVDEERYPNISAWVKRVSEVSSVKKSLQDPEKVLEFVRTIRMKILGSLD